MIHFDYSGALMVTHFKDTAFPKTPLVCSITQVSGDSGRQTVYEGLTCLRPGISVCVQVRVCLCKRMCVCVCEVAS